MAEGELGQREPQSQQNQRQAGGEDEAAVGPRNEVENGERGDQGPDEQDAPREHRRPGAGAAFPPQNENQGIAEQDEQAEGQPGDAGRGGGLKEAEQRETDRGGSHGEEAVAHHRQRPAQFEKGEQAKRNARQHQALDECPQLLAAFGAERQPAHQQRQISRLDGEKHDRGPGEQRGG